MRRQAPQKTGPNIIQVTHAIFTNGLTIYGLEFLVSIHVL